MTLMRRDLPLVGRKAVNRRVTVEDLMHWGHYRDYAAFLGISEDEVKYYLSHPGTFVPTPAQLAHAEARGSDWSRVHSETIEQFLLRRFSRKQIERVREEIRERRVQDANWEREHGSRRRTYLLYFVRWKSWGEIALERQKARWRGR